MPRPKGCKCGVLKSGERCPVHGDATEGAAAPTGEGSAPAGGRNPAGGQRRGKDPAPQPRARARKAKVRPSDKELEDGLRKALKTCSIPMRFRCDYCADHMLATAPTAAKMAIEDADLRDIIERLYVWCLQYAGAGGLALFFGIPFLHHLAPPFVYRPVAPLIGMPARAPRGARAHQHPHPHPPAPAPAPARNGSESPQEPLGADSSPFAGMDIAALAGMARGFGIEIPDLSGITGAVAAADDELDIAPAGDLIGDDLEDLLTENGNHASAETPAGAAADELFTGAESAAVDAAASQPHPDAEL